jgi:hypothetical protein
MAEGEDTYPLIAIDLSRVNVSGGLGLRTGRKRTHTYGINGCPVQVQLLDSVFYRSYGFFEHVHRMDTSKKKYLRRAS